MRSLLLLILSAYALKAYAQEFNTIHYNTNNSQLPHDICYRLMQDETGYIWISTDDGLVRFDGRDMKIYRQGFRSRYVIASARYGNNFMISTWKGGVHFLRNDSVIPFSMPRGYYHELFNSNNILVYKNIAVVGTFDSTFLYHYDASEGKLSAFEAGISYGKNCSDRIKHETGMRFSIINDRLIAYNSKGVFELKGNCFYRSRDDAFSYITQTADQDIYASKSNAIYRIDAFSGTPVLYRDFSFTDRTIDRFYMLPSGNIILKLLYVNPSKELGRSGKYLFVNTHTGSTHDLIEELQIKAMVADILPGKEGDFWVSTDGDGLYHVFEPRYLQYGNHGEFENPFITALYEHKKEGLYIGTKNGIYLLRDQKIKALYGNYYTSSFFDTDKACLSATSKLRQPNLRICGDKAVIENRLYYYGAAGHYIWSNSNDTAFYLKDTLRNIVLTRDLGTIYNPIKGIAEDPDGTLWLGSPAGLCKWNKLTQKSEIWQHPALSRISVSQLFCDSTGTLWVASNMGLFRIRKGNLVQHYTEKNGLSNSNINAMLLCKDQLWIGTQSGLNIMDSKSGHISVVRKYDGLVSNDVTVLCKFRNYIAIGGSKGLTLIDPSQFVQHINTPKLILENIRINDKKISSASALSAPYQGRISIDYNVISFIYPDLVTFQYRLSARDAWIETRNKSLVLNNLSPGRYELQLRAKKYNSSWSQPLLLDIEVQEPWWQTVPFYLGMACSLGFLVYLFIRGRERRFRQRLSMKQQFSELKLKALQTQLNPHFISNSLNAIQLLGLQNNETASNEYLTRFGRLTRLLLESSRSRFISLKDELLICDYYLSLEMLRFSDRFSYTISVDSAIDTEHELVPGVLLQPFIENSINHGIVYLPQHTHGHICISVKKQQHAIEIEVDDNGIGRKKANEIKQKVEKSYRSRSSEIISEISQAVNYLPSCFISINTTDKYNNKGEASGTNVHITCSINPIYKN